MARLYDDGREDLANSRRMLIQSNVFTKANGEKVIRVLPYQYVTYDNGAKPDITGWEPTNAYSVEGLVTGQGGASEGIEALDSDKHITGIEFLSEGQLQVVNQDRGPSIAVGGDWGWPIA
jgi:hypothetical protein